MSRTLTASTRNDASHRRHLPAAYQEDVFAIVLSCIDELWTAGSRYKVLSPKLATLNAQLDDPALANHPKRNEAMARYWTWHCELIAIEEQADSLQANLARHLDRLRPERLAVWRAIEGWPTSWGGKEIAAWVWRQGITERMSVLGEAPF